MAHPLQELYDACKATFTLDGLPSQGLQRVRSIIDTITPSDLGLDKVTFSQQDRGFGFFGLLNGRKGRHTSMLARWAPPISYLHIHDCEYFSMGIFCLPTSAVIPLHDHPGMTVLSKLLYGSVHVKSYDWVDPVVERHQTGTPHLRLAKLVADQVLSAPCESSALYPRSGGNIHCLTGVTPCAVLDVLAPPYSTEDDRNCTYYRDFPYSSHSENMNTDGIEEGLAWLQEYQPPDDFVVKPVPYKAPNIIL